MTSAERSASTRPSRTELRVAGELVELLVQKLLNILRSPFGGGGFGGMFGDFFGFGNQEEEHQKGDLVVVPLMVTLEELYNGALIDMLRTKVSF